MKTTPEQLNTVHVDEDFISIETRSIDSKHRITLSDKAVKAVRLKNKKITSYQVLVGKRGDILLRPSVSIPASEAWIYENPEVIASIRRGLKQAKEGKITKVHDLDKFLENL